MTMKDLSVARPGMDDKTATSTAAGADSAEPSSPRSPMSGSSPSSPSALAEGAVHYTKQLSGEAVQYGKQLWGRLKDAVMHPNVYQHGDQKRTEGGARKMLRSRVCPPRSLAAYFY